jgi:hypothetical protein
LAEVVPSSRLIGQIMCANKANTTSRVRDRVFLIEFAHSTTTMSLLLDTTSDALSSALNTSEFNVLTELQRADDFRSTAVQPVQEEEVVSSYYKGVIWYLIPSLRGVATGKGASKSFIYKYGWRLLKPDTSPIQYFWICTSCHKQRSHRKHAYNVSNGTDSAISHLLTAHNIDKDGPRERSRSIADQVSGQPPSSSRISSSSMGYDIEDMVLYLTRLTRRGQLLLLSSMRTLLSAFSNRRTCNTA